MVEGRLEERLKEGKNPKIKLAEDSSALYIGSGPDIKKVSHLLDLVDAARYILSDLEFERDETTQFQDCEVKTTNRDGFKILEEEQVGFLMLDNALLGRFEEAYQNLDVGSYVYIHATFFEDTHWSNPFYNERVGLKEVEGMLFRKVREPTQEDIDVAYQIVRVSRIADSVYCLLNDSPREPSLEDIEVLAGIIGDVSKIKIEPSVFDEKCSIIDKPYLAKTARELTEAVTYLAPRVNEKELAYLRGQVAGIAQRITSMGNPFYTELQTALQKSVDALKE